MNKLEIFVADFMPLIFAKMRILYFFSLLCFSICLFSCQSGNSGSQSTASPSTSTQTAIISEKLSSEDFLNKLNEKGRAQLVDVRTPGEYEAGKIAEAQNINIQDAGFKDQVSQLDKSQPVFVYCAKGGRSGRAAKQLEELGFVEIYDLTGGYTDWSAKGMEK